MVNMIKADFYKLFRKKSFYVCGIIGIVISLLSILLINSSFGGFSPSFFGYDGVKALFFGLPSGSLFCTIFLSLFVTNEFSFGTIKNIISSGQNRISIYISKLIVALFISFTYTVLFGLSAFILGSNLWGLSELSRGDYLSIIRSILLVVLVEFAMQSVFTMIGFLVRKSSGTLTLNIVVSMFSKTFLFPILNLIAYKLFNVTNFESEKFWPTTYLSYFLSLDIKTEDILLGLAVCGATIVISSIIGLVSFIQRDIK